MMPFLFSNKSPCVIVAHWIWLIAYILHWKWKRWVQSMKFVIYHSEMFEILMKDKTCFQWSCGDLVPFRSTVKFCFFEWNSNFFDIFSPSEKFNDDQSMAAKWKKKCLSWQQQQRGNHSGQIDACDKRYLLLRLIAGGSNCSQLIESNERKKRKEKKNSKWYRRMKWFWVVDCYKPFNKLMQHWISIVNTIQNNNNNYRLFVQFVV